MPKLSSRRRLIWLRLVALGAFAHTCVTPATAQQDGLEARLTYVAGVNLYVAAGRDDGLVPGDTLLVVLGDSRPVSVTVRSAMRDRAVLELIQPTTLAETGDSIRLLLDNGSDLVPTQSQVDRDRVTIAPDARTIQPPVVESAVVPRARSRNPLIARGRLLVGLVGVRSVTRSLASPSTSATRVFLTPSVGASFNVAGLPAGVSFRTRLRVDYRHTNGAPIRPQTLVRAYEVALEKELSSGLVRVGRFANRYARSGGYWDGLLLEYGGSRSGIGTSIGFLPERSNASFSAETPKVAVFARTSHRIKGIDQSVNAWYQQIHPSGAIPTRRNFGLSHRARLRAFVSDNDFEVDRDPDSGRLVLTRGSMQMSGLVRSWIAVRGRYEIRQPYSIYRSANVISYRRDRATLGSSLMIRKVSVSADLVWNYFFRPETGREPDGRTFRISVASSLSRSLRIMASANRWTSDTGNSSMVSAGISQSVGRLLARMNYRLSRSTRFESDVTSHFITAEASLPLTRKIRTTTQLRFQGGSNLSSVAFNLNLAATL